MPSKARPAKRWPSWTSTPIQVCLLGRVPARPIAYANVQSCQCRREARSRDDRDGSTRSGYVQCVDRESSACRIHRLRLRSYAYAGLDNLGRRLQVLEWALRTHESWTVVGFSFWSCRSKVPSQPASFIYLVPQFDHRWSRGPRAGSRGRSRGRLCRMLSQQDVGLAEDGRMYGSQSATWRDAPGSLCIEASGPLSHCHSLSADLVHGLVLRFSASPSSRSRIPASPPEEWNPSLPEF